jgi:hypothetical protein
VLAVGVGIVAAGVLVAAPGVDGTWADLVPLIGQSAVFLTSWTLFGVAFGAILLTPAPAIVIYFTLPLAWMAVASLSFFEDVAPWLDSARALAPMPMEVMSTTQWAQAGTAIALWMLLPLLIGTWRITRREVSV